MAIPVPYLGPKDELTGLIGKHVSGDEAKSALARFSGFRAWTQDLAPEEGAPPQHFLSCEQDGIVIRHSDSGHVETIFLYVAAKDGFGRFAGPLPGGVSLDATQKDVRAAMGAPSFVATAFDHPALGRLGDGLRYDFPAHSVHFQFRADSDGIDLVTLMAAAATPGRADG